MRPAAYYPPLLTGFQKRCTLRETHVPIPIEICLCQGSEELLFGFAFPF
jgi:hypothetical protein